MHISCGHAVLATLASAITLCQHTQYVSHGTSKTRVSIQLDWLWINLALVLRKTYFHQLRKSFEYNFTQPRIRWWKYKRDESKQNPRIGKRCIIVPYNWGLPSCQFNSVFFIEFVFKVMHRENGMYCMYFPFHRSGSLLAIFTYHRSIPGYALHFVGTSLEGMKCQWFYRKTPCTDQVL